MSFSKDSKQKLILIAAVVIVALIGLNAYLLYNNSQQKDLYAQEVEDRKAVEELKVELEKQYYDALAELESMRGNEENLNALIDEQKLEIEEKKNKISGLLRSKSDLKKAKSELGSMRSQLDQYIAEINTLKEENELLAQANTQLSQDKEMLQGEVAQERTMNEELTTAKAALTSQKENLESENAELSKTATYASVVHVRDVSASGYKQKSNGKSRKKKYAKNIDYLKVCFTALPNEVTVTGMEQFFVRIINPLGETMAIEDLGSGVTKNTKTGEEIRYTKIKELEYNQAESVACFLWEPNVPFSKGNYDVEVYNKGYLAGKGTFNLK